MHFDQSPEEQQALQELGLRYIKYREQLATTFLAMRRPAHGVESTQRLSRAIDEINAVRGFLGAALLIDWQIPPETHPISIAATAAVQRLQAEIEHLASATASTVAP